MNNTVLACTVLGLFVAVVGALAVIAVLIVRGVREDMEVSEHMRAMLRGYDQ